MAKPKDEKKNMSEFTKESEWWFKEVRSWLARVPLASLIAFWMCVGGIVIFSVCLYLALEFLVKQFDLDIISKIVWLIMILHIAMATMFLLVAILSTGGTRKEVCTKCVVFNIAGRCCQCVCMAIAYLFHFIWLLLPCALLFPVGLLTAFAILCQILPDCISLGDYGIPPEMLDKIKPEDIIDKIRSINSSDLEGYIDKAEVMIEGAIESAENSPILEDILSKIENNIPDEAEIERFISMVVDKIDTDQVVNVIDQIQGGIDKGADAVHGALDKASEHIDNINIGGTIADQLDNIQGNVQGIANQTAALNPLDNIPTNNISDMINQLDNKTNAILRDNTTVDAIIGPALSGNESISARRKRQIDETELIDESKRQKVDEEIQEIQKDAKENIDTIRKDVSQAGKDISGKVQDELNTLRNDTEKRLSGIQDQAKDIMQNVSNTLEGTKNELVAKAEDIKNTVQETADAVRTQAEKTAAELKEEAEKTAENLKNQAAAAAKDIEDKGKQVVEDVTRVIEEEQERIKQGIEDAKALGNKTIQEITKKTQELVEEGKKHLGDIKDKAQEIGQDVKEMGEDAVKEFVDNAKQIADEAKMIAEVASREAEKAMQKALDASKAVALEVDKKAKALARETEARARKAAEDARQAANSALEKARMAIQNADELKDAVAKGSADLIRKAAMNVRHYAQEAIRVAKIAAREGINAAREAAKMFDSVKEEVLKGYEMFMTFADQMGIERKEGSDTFCSEAKVKYCNEIIKSQLYMIFVFGSSIILNLSMVHFLMAMAANYVHIKRELKNARLEEEMKEAIEAKEDEPEGKPHADGAGDEPLLPRSASEDALEMAIMDFKLSDTGSFVTKI